jgi:transposase
LVVERPGAGAGGERGEAVSPTGAVLDQLTVPANAKGYRRLIAFGERHDGRLWAIEGTGSFGAGLTTALLAHDERVVEVDRPERPARRAGAKSDDIDAVRAARQVLAGQGVSEPRSRGQREAIRVLLATRAQAIDFRTRAIAALHALVTSAPDNLRQRLRGLPFGELLRTCSALGGSPRQSAEEFATVTAMRATARRALACEREAAELEGRPWSRPGHCAGSARCGPSTWPRPSSRGRSSVPGVG